MQPNATWEWEGFKLELAFDVPRQFERNMVGYKFYDEGRLLFEGQDFGPSTTHDVDSLQSVIELLSFLTLQPGDVDPEYFTSYTAEQLEWVSGDLGSRAEVLRQLVNDYEENDNEPRLLQLDCGQCGRPTVEYAGQQPVCMWCGAKEIDGYEDEGD